MHSRHRIAAMLLASSTLLPVSALAQVDAAQAGGAQDDAAADALEAQALAPVATEAQAAPADQIVVTGSRIARPDFAAPNPIVSISSADLQRSGDTNVTTYLKRIPALTNSLDSTRVGGNAQADGAIGQAGLNLLDLRALGTNRTLVLVNGRRHVASQFDTAAVDINTIPTDLIDRVDVVTGAESAVYGADAVSGVVNFVLKRDFNGIAARAQLGVSGRGDAANRFASIIAGRSFADGRGNVTLGYEYSAEQALANDDRGYLRSENRVFFVNNGNYVPGQAGSYARIPLADNRYSGFYVDGDGAPQPGGSFQNIIKVGKQFFRGDGQPYVFGSQAQSFDTSVGGDDSPIAGYIGDLTPRLRRHAVNLLAHYDFSDAAKLSFEGKFVQVTSRTFGAYSGTYGVPITLDNPFLPLSIRNAAIANGDTAVFINRNNFDLPRRGEGDRRRTWRGVVDLAGRISDHAQYDISYTYGRTDVRATKLNDRLPARSSQALDAVRDPATGQIVCRSATARAAGCVPLNPFGAYTADPASFSYVYENPVSNARIQQHVVNASLTGDFGQFFELPGGPIQFAAGGEYRRESSRFSPAAGLLFNADTGATSYYSAADGIYDEPVPLTPSSAKFHVWELFGEVNLPILKDRPLAYLLSVGAAGRYSHYSTVGSTKAYQFNGIYAPIQAISFRGSYGRSVRAPNIAELFRPRTGFSDFITDPCYLTNRGQGTQYRPANCEALIRASGGNPATFNAANNPDANLNIPGTQQGNPDLSAEVARTWTAGVVLRPGFVPRLQIGIDWYNIRLRNAINTPTATDVANLCVDLPSLNNPYCGTITRRQGTGYVSAYTVQPQNVAAFRTAGLELNVSYRVDTDRTGRFDLQLVGGYVHRLEQLPLPGAVIVNSVDQPPRGQGFGGSPKYTVVFSPTWSLGSFSLTYNLQWRNGLRRFTRIETDSNPNLVDPRYFRFKELWQHDVQFNLATSAGFSFYGGVNNLTDQRPSIGFETNVPISPVGRFFYVGAKINLGAS